MGSYLNSLEYAVAEPPQKPLPVSLNAESGFNIIVDMQSVCFIQTPKFYAMEILI